MLILLPPSETKRPGGDAAAFEPAGIALPELAPLRTQVVDALVALSDDPAQAAKVLKLSARQAGEVAVNAALHDAPTMPAVDRYTGVLFDALGADALDAAARRWLGVHVLIHSAPFGPVGALDLIPAYRLAAGTTLPGLAPQKRFWSASVTAALAVHAPSFVLDLRSEAYAALGPVPVGVDAAYLRIVSEGEDGAVRALNHFNKHTKGALVRALAEDRPRIGSLAAFARWCDAHGWRLREGASAGEWELFAH